MRSWREKEKEEILGRIQQIQKENQDFAARYVEIEAENNNLANLYIASYQLHSTLDFKEVLQIIMEIIINLIGAEEFAVMLLDEKTNELTAVAIEGIPRDQIPPVRYGKGIIGNVAKTGENYFVDDIATYKRDILNPMVCIPLQIKEHVIGVIVILDVCGRRRRILPSLIMNCLPCSQVIPQRLSSVPSSTPSQNGNYRRFKGLLICLPK